MANKATIRLLSSYFGVPPSRIRLVRGARSRNKIFEVRVDGDA